MLDNWHVHELHQGNETILDNSNDIKELKNPLPDITFEQLPLPLKEAAKRANWTGLMPVQARAIPYLLARRDMIIQARTGSGKTGAFLLSDMSSGVTAEILAQAYLGGRLPDYGALREPTFYAHGEELPRAYALLASLNNSPRNAFLARITNPNPALATAKDKKNHE